MHQNFDALCWWLEDNFDELCSLDELHMKMITIAGSVDTLYLRKHLKRKLIEHYGDNIFFSDVNGKHNVVCFWNVASVIYHLHPMLHVVHAAAFADPLQV